MIDPHVLPPGFAQHVRDRTASQAEPAKPRLAATTVLVRGGTPGVPGSVEVFLQKRPETMAFAASMLVFPGGSVDRGDAQVIGADGAAGAGGAVGADANADADAVPSAAAGPAWRGLAPAEWADRLDCDERAAAAVVCAAARELFEEAGVLLAGPGDTDELQDISDPAWEDARVALESRQTSMGRFLLERGLVLRSDLLAPWRSWLTPDFEPKRFDTRFLVAAAPVGQVARTVSGETTDSLWIPVGKLLPRIGTEYQMLAPQIFTCAELYEFDSADALVESARSTRRAGVTPYLGGTAEQPRLEFLPELDEILDRVGAAIG